MGSQAVMHDVGPSKIVVKERFRSSKWFMFKWSPMRLIRSSTSPNAARLAALAHKQRGYLVDFAVKYLLQKLQGRANQGHTYASVMVRSSPTTGFKLIFQGSEEAYDLCTDTKIGFSEELDGRLKADLVERLKDLGYKITLSEAWMEGRWGNDMAQHFHVSWA